jgi:hypothetical protein
MDAFVLPGLAVIIFVALLWLSTRWLGKKENRALHRFGEPPPLDGADAQDPRD